VIKKQKTGGRVEKGYAEGDGAKIVLNGAVPSKNTRRQFLKTILLGVIKFAAIEGMGRGDQERIVFGLGPQKKKYFRKVGIPREIAQSEKRIFSQK